MKRIAVLILGLALILMLAGCATGRVSDASVSKAENNNRMFTIISYEVNGMVVVNKATKVMYWLSNGSYCHGTLTLLVNPNGTPMIWEG